MGARGAGIVSCCYDWDRAVVARVLYGYWRRVRRGMTLILWERSRRLGYRCGQQAQR